MNLIQATSQIVWATLSPVEQRIIAIAAEKQKTLNSRTLMGGEGNAAGFAGQKLLHNFAPSLIDHSETEIDWDFLPPSGSPTIDVKSKGNNKYAPALHYDCSVPCYQVEGQDCQIYVFTRIVPGFGGGWLLGFIEKTRFIKEATLRAAGSAYNNAGRKTRGNHLVLLIERLFPMQAFAEMIA